MDEYIANTAIPLLHFGLALEQRVHNGLITKLGACLGPYQKFMSIFFCEIKITLLKPLLYRA